MTDLEQLVRETLSGRAATVTRGPAGAEVPGGGRRRSWPAVAAAVAVLGLAGGLAVLRGSDSGTVQAGGRAATSCAAPLPTSWQRAAHRLAPRSGDFTNVRAVTPAGVGIGEARDPEPGYERIVLVPLHGTDRVLLRVRTNREVLSVDTDGTSAVLAITPALTRDYRPRPAVDDVAVLDLHTGHLRHILAGAPIPPGWIVTWSSTVIQHGVVYLLARPRQATATSGDVLSFSLRTGRYAVVSRVAAVDPDPDPFDHQQLVRDIRGVAWRGGSVADPAAPTGLPAFFTSNGVGGRYQPVHSDGHDVAWQDAADPFVVHWRGGDGAARTLRVDPYRSRSLPPTVNAVAGPYVFARVEGRATELVLDTRSRAVAFFDAWGNGALDSRGALKPPTVATALLLGTAALPGLACARH